MPDEAIHLEHEAELSLAASALQEAGMSVQLLERGQGLALTTLMVALGPDDEDRQRTMAISIMPFDDEQFADTQFTQFYVPMPFELGDAKAQVQQATATINTAMAVGHFSVRGDELFYRYMLATPRDAALDPDMLRELVTLLDFHQEHFSDYLEGVNDGEVSLLVLDKLIDQTS